MRVDLKRERYRGVPKLFAHDLRRDPGRQTERSSCMPQIVETDIWEAGMLEQRLELAPYQFRLPNRTAVGRLKDKIARPHIGQPGFFF